MIYNKISGSSVNPNTALLFKQFEDEQCYLAFARSGETWGMSALINITMPTDSLVDIMKQSTTTAGRFADKKSLFYNLDDSVVRIYYTEGNVPDFSTDMTKYHSVKDQNIIDTDIYLEYINATWCVLKNLPSNYREFINTNENRKFYIAAKQDGNKYPENPDSTTKMVKINLKSVLDFSTLKEQVTMYISYISTSTGERTDEPYLPTASITRSTTLLGETSFTGLTDVLGIDEAVALNYVNESMSPTGTYFYFTNMKGAKVSDKMFLQPYIGGDGKRSIWHYEGSGNDKKYLLFESQHSFTINTAVDTQNYFVKVSFASPPNELAIYHETLPFIYPTVNAGNNISDANPPGLDVTYLNNISIHNSLFDVQGYVRIRKTPNTTNNQNIYSKISYVKELVSTEDRQQFANLGFSTTDMTKARRIETITMTVSEPVSRYGNVRPKPNGSAYAPTDVRLYLWSTNFIVGDTIAIKTDMHNPESVILKKITGINYEEGYVTFGSNQPIGTNVIPTDNDQILSELSQVVSQPSKIINVIEYAVCDNMKEAMSFGMDSVMIEMKIPPSGTDLYDGVYRQIAVVHRPKYYDLTGLNGSNPSNCTDAGSDSFRESDTTTLYYDGPNGTNHSWEPGTILYLANKTPVYRKYITSREYFKIII